LLLLNRREILALLLCCWMLEGGDLFINSDTFCGRDGHLFPVPRFGFKEHGKGRIPALGLDNLGSIIKLLKSAELAKHEDGLELRCSIVDYEGDCLSLREL